MFDSANEGILVYDRTLEHRRRQPVGRAHRRPAARQIIGAAGFTSLPAVRRTPTARRCCRTERPTRITLRTGKSLTGHVMGIKRPGGAYTWLSVNTAIPAPIGDERLVRRRLHHSPTSRAQKHAEAALSESEERYRRTFELAGSGLAHVGLDGRFMRVNRALCEMFGYSEEELAGTTVKEISHPDDRDMVERAAPGARTPGAVDAVRIEKRYLRKDGAAIWAEVAIDVRARRRRQAALRDLGARRHHRAASTSTRRCARARSATAAPSSSPARASRTSARSQVHPRQPAPVRDPRLRGGRADRHDRPRDLAPGRPRRDRLAAAARCTPARSTTCASRSATCARTTRWCG